LKTVLEDRILFYDGTCQVSSDKIVDLLIQGVPIERIAAFECDDDVLEYNRLADVSIKCGEVDIDFSPDFSWKIPSRFFNLEISTTLHNLLSETFEYVANFQKYQERLEIELQEIKIRNLDSLVKTLMYVIDYFKSNDVVYGVGRGSSCASLIMFLIGVHCIDPVKYDISHLEFFHD
jgi:hypothetical protein